MQKNNDTLQPYFNPDLTSKPNCWRVIGESAHNVCLANQPLLSHQSDLVVNTSASGALSFPCHSFLKHPTAGLKFWSVQHPDTPKDFPQTMALFGKVPHLISLSFSQLMPGADLGLIQQANKPELNSLHSVALTFLLSPVGTSITPHNGDTNAHMRCHMGIKIPGKLPECGFQVRAA